MGFQNLMPRIMGFLVVILTLAMAPNINTENAAIIAANLTNCIGMSAISAFGAPLIILGLLVGGGIFAVSGTTLVSGASMKDMLEMIASVIAVIVMLSLFSHVITYTNTLIDASSGFAVTIYGIIPIVIYVGIIATAGWRAAKAFRRAKKGRGRGSVAAQY